MKQFKVRAAVLLLLAMLTISTAWAANVSYYDPTASAGQEMKTANVTALTIQENLNSGWYYVSNTVSRYNRININGTVNVILADYSELVAFSGIRVASGNTLNIYAQSAGKNRGKLNARLLDYPSVAAIGGNGDGEDAGTINIYGGNIQAYGNIGGGPGENNSGDGGTINFYGGRLTTSGAIGGGSNSNNGIINLSWSNPSDKIQAAQYNGTVTLQKDFVDKSNGQPVTVSTVAGKAIIPAGNFPRVIIGSLLEDMSIDTNLTEDEDGNQYAVEGQVVTFDFDCLYEFEPEIAVYYDSDKKELAFTDNGNYNYSFVMPNSIVTIKVTNIPSDESNVHYYYDPTAAAGQQRKTVDAKTLTSQRQLSSGWYYVDGNVTISNRIDVGGTANIILADGCHFTASKGIKVANGNTLNIYAQSAGGTRGSLTAGHDWHDAAIGGNGGEDRAGHEMKGGNGEDAGNINIYGGNITTNGNLGGGEGGHGDYYEQWNNVYLDDNGYGGFCDNIRIYGGKVTVNGMLGGDHENFEDGQGSNSVVLSWTNPSDRIYASRYDGDGKTGPWGNVTLAKSFIDNNSQVRNAATIDASDIDGKTLKPNTSDLNMFTVTVGPLTDSLSVNVDIEADANGDKYAVVDQEVAFRYSLPTGHHPRFVVYKTNERLGSLPLTSNQDGSCSFTMPQGNVIIDFSTATLGPNDVKYYDPTVNIGQQRRVAIQPTQITTQTSLASGWYYVSGEVTIDDRINVNGTVNLILTDGCDFLAEKGIRVTSGNTLNIYAQSTGNNRGVLTAGHSKYDAAIGGNGGKDGYDGTHGSDGEDAGSITIYGGNITTTSNIGGGDGGKGWAYTIVYASGTDSNWPGYGGNGGNCGDIAIYSGNVYVHGSIGSGSGGKGQDAFGEYGTGVNGADGSGITNLYWSNASDRILASRYNGTVYLSKYFKNGEGDLVVGLADNSIYGDTIKPHYEQHIVSLGSVPEGVTIDLDLEADENGDKLAAREQCVNVDYSEVPEGFHLSFSTDPEMWWVEGSTIFDNGDNSIAVLMINSPLTINTSLSFTLSDRTLYKDGYWNTLCLPFDLALANSSLSDATVMGLDAATSGFSDGTLTLNFTEVDTIVAGKPYLVKWATEGENLVNPTFYDLGLKNASPEDEKVTTTDGYVSFVGTYEAQNFLADDKKTLYMGGNNTLYYPESDMTLGAFRAFFRLNSSSQAPARIVTNFGEQSPAVTTDIHSLSKEEAPVKFFRNGQLFIRRAGVTYDVTGRKATSY